MILPPDYWKAETLGRVVCRLSKYINIAEFIQSTRVSYVISSSEERLSRSSNWMDFVTNSPPVEAMSSPHVLLSYVMVASSKEQACCHGG